MRPPWACLPGSKRSWAVTRQQSTCRKASGTPVPLASAAPRRAAEYLLSRGADLNWEPDYAHGTPLDSATGLGTRQENVISWLRELGARSASSN